MVDRTKQRIEFSPKIRKLTAERAGFRCSFPGCDRLTIGPSDDPNKSSNVGKASHIYGAAVSGRGPRSTGGLSKEELASQENAIWLCGHHADLIDKHGGNDYPAGRLHSYKALHETRIAHELSGVHSPFGWVDKVRIGSSPLFVDGSEIDLAKLTLVIGDNSIGKSALCEWIAASVHAHYLERWAEIIPAELPRVSSEIDFHNPDPHVTGFSFLSSNHPKYMFDQKCTVIPTAPLKIVFPGEISFEYQEEPNDDLDRVAKALNMHPYDVLALLEDMKTNCFDCFKSAWLDEHDEGRSMYVQLETNRSSGPRLLKTMAASERARLVMQLGILAAMRFAAMYPTLLLLDSGFCRLDTDWMKCYAELLGSTRFKFQTVAATRSTKINFDDLTWAGWKIFRLQGKPPDVVIRAGFCDT